MLLIDKPTTCLNWQFIDKEKFPEHFNNSNVKEDFELLFQQNFDPIKLKELLRTSIREPNQAARKFLWKRILLQQDTSQTQLTIEKYNKKISVLFGKNLTLTAEMPGFICADNLAFYYLNEEGKATVCRVLNVLASVHPDITYAPLLLPLASLFLHYMSEPECFACLLSVVESKNKITQTDIHWTTTNHVFRRFAQKYSRTSYQYVLDALFRRTNDLDTSLEVLDEWQWWIFQHLPFNYVLNIVDCFLLEGQKVLYRFGICILDYFYKSYNTCSSSFITSGHHIHRPSKLEVDAIINFCQKINVPQEQLIKSAFGLRNMRRKDIEIVFQAEEKSIKKIRAKNNVESSLSFSNSSGLNILHKGNHTVSKLEGDKPLIGIEKKFENFCSNSLLRNKKSKDKTNKQTTHDNQQNAQNGFSSKNTNQSSSNGMTRSASANWQVALKTINLGKKWRASTNKAIKSHLSYHHHYPQSELNLPSFSLESTGSLILDPRQIAQLWRWLPKRYQILELQVIYSTNIHGCRMMTLFDKIEFYPASIIVLQTSTGSIFGAFCSQPWSNRINSTRYRKPSFFGNGETFLFELKPDIAKYEWVGKSCNGNTSANQELFMYADNEKLVIGGGNTETTTTSTPIAANPDTEREATINTMTSSSTSNSSSTVPSLTDNNKDTPIVHFTTEVDSNDSDSKKLDSTTITERGMGLVIDSELFKGRSAISDTFENKVLGNEVDFTIIALEVLSFNASLD